MKWVSFVHNGTEGVGVVDEEVIHAHAPGVDLLQLLEEGTDLVGEGERLIAQAARRFELGDVQLRAPIPSPPSIRDFYAFEEHAQNARRARGLELVPEWFELPVFYFSNPASVVGPRDPVPMAPGTERWDYELEVAAIIGKPGSDLDPSEAEDCIAGYCVMADFSARDLQAREMRVGLGPAKGKDTATSLGPWLVTPDELRGHRTGNRLDLAMAARVNGTDYSAGSLGDIYWTFGQMIAYASRGTTVRPGDVIGSGTVGTGCILELSALHGESQYPWLRPGDTVRMEVESLGALEHRIVPAPRPDPAPLR